MRIAQIQRFCTHDGPGLRTTVFLKGCPLRCKWCHNPETQHMAKEVLFYTAKCIGCGMCSACAQGAHIFAPDHVFSRSLCVVCGLCAKACPTRALELVGEDLSLEEVYRQVQKDAAFFGPSGGVTLSGGEPFSQGEEAIALLTLCKQGGMGTAVETCGYFDSELLPRAAAVTDLFLWDVKDTDPVRHQAYTGVSNEKILRNLTLADSLGAKTRLRCILVGGVNTDPRHYEAVAALAARLQHCEGVEWIPYHVYGGAKSAALSGVNSGNDSWIPTDGQLAAAKEHLRARNIPVF